MKMFLTRFLPLLLVLWTTELAARTIVDRVVAVIEDDVITARQLAKKVEPYLAQLESITSPEDKKQAEEDLFRRILELEIGETLIQKEVERNKAIVVAESEIERAIDEVAKMNNVSRDTLQTELYRQGMTWSEYRRNIKDRIARQRLVQFKVQGRVQLQDSDVKRKCEERQNNQREQLVCASHILFSPGENPDETEAEAKRVRAALVAGGSFADLAEEHNDDTGSPGGALGCFGRGEMVDAFETAAYALEAGEYSKVIKTVFGFHIILVNERKAVSLGSCDDPASLEQVRGEMFQAEMDRQMKSWIDELRTKAFVEVRL